MESRIALAPLGAPGEQPLGPTCQGIPGSFPRRGACLGDPVTGWDLLKALSFAHLHAQSPLTVIGHVPHSRERTK